MGSQCLSIRRNSLAKITYTYQEAGDTISAATLNLPFAALKNGTDGTVGRITSANVRGEGIQRIHLPDDGEAINTNLVVGDYDTTDWTNPFGDVVGDDLIITHAVTGSPSFIAGEVLRAGMDVMIGDTWYQSGGGTAAEEQNKFHFQLRATVNLGAGNVVVNLTPWFGNAISGVMENGMGTNHNPTCWWEKATLNGMHFCRANTQVINILLYVRSEKTNNRLDINKVHAWFIGARN